MRSCSTPRLLDWTELSTKRDSFSLSSLTRSARERLKGNWSKWTMVFGVKAGVHTSIYLNVRKKKCIILKSNTCCIVVKDDKNGLFQRIYIIYICNACIQTYNTSKQSTIYALLNLHDKVRIYFQSLCWAIRFQQGVLLKETVFDLLRNGAVGRLIILSFWEGIFSGALWNLLNSRRASHIFQYRLTSKKATWIFPKCRAPLHDFQFKNPQNRPTPNGPTLQWRCLSNSTIRRQYLKVFSAQSHRIHGNGIVAYIWLIFMVNLGKYTIHGWYGKSLRICCQIKSEILW